MKRQERITCTRRIEWDAAHRVPGHEGKCKAIHGHRFAAEITCEANRLDNAGMVVDFGIIKAKVGAWIDEHWDHSCIFQEGDPLEAVQAVAEANGKFGRPAYFMAEPPTSENLARELAGVARELLAYRCVDVVKVRLQETPNCWATWTC